MNRNQQNDSPSGDRDGKAGGGQPPSPRASGGKPNPNDNLEQWEREFRSAPHGLGQDGGRDDTHRPDASSRDESPDR